MVDKGCTCTHNYLSSEIFTLDKQGVNGLIGKGAPITFEKPEFDTPILTYMHPVKNMSGFAPPYIILT